MASRNLTAHHSPSSPATRILLVDDNANGLAARKSVLEELGHCITTAAGGAEALEKFASEKFDLVVTDYKMPRMDGTELIGRLRVFAPGLAVIMLSGFTDPLGMDEKSTGADAVIQKSANEVSHLVRAVNRLLKRKAAPRPVQTPLDASLQTPLQTTSPQTTRIAKKPAATAASASQSASGTVTASTLKRKNS
jgi:CheY-like chemotaxis protein